MKFDDKIIDEIMKGFHSSDPSPEEEAAAEALVTPAPEEEASDLDQLDHVPVLDEEAVAHAAAKAADKGEASEETPEYGHYADSADYPVEETVEDSEAEAPEDETPEYGEYAETSEEDAEVEDSSDPADDQDAFPADGQEEEEVLPPEKDPRLTNVNPPNKFLVIGLCLLVALIGAAAISFLIMKDTPKQQEPVIPEGVVAYDLAAGLQSYSAAEVTNNEGVKAYTLEEIYNLDLRQPSNVTADDLKQITRGGLVGLEESFVQAEETYGVNCVFLVSIASVESAYGTICYRPNNMFGYGGKSYASKHDCIMDVASGLSSRYLNPGDSLYGGSSTVKGVNKRYAANPQWYAKVGKYMQQYYSVISPYHNQTLSKIQ